MEELPLPRPLVDAHVHLMPDRLFRAVWRYFAEHLWPIRYQDTTEGLVATLRRELGVSRFVFMSYAHKAGVAAELNRWSAETAARFPDSVPLATFHPGDPDVGRLADEAWLELKLAGAKLHCQVGRFAPDDRRLFPVYERACVLDKPIVFHVGRAPEGGEHLGPEPFARLLRAFPDLPAIVAHMGADEFEPFFALAERFPRVYLDTTLVYTDLLDWRPDPRRLVDLQDRLLFGSDFPDLPYPVRHGVDSLRRLGLGPEVEAKLFWRNANRLFQLGLAEA